MGLKEIFQAIREYPAACSELRQAQQALEQSEQKCRALEVELGEQSHYLNFLSQRSAALQAALEEFCPKVSTLGEIKQLYNTISPHLDPKGFALYHLAERITGIDVPSFFPYEDNRGLFTEADGHQLLRYLISAHFHAVDWTIVPGTAYEEASLREVDTSTPEYQAFERELYEKTLERMGFQDILAPQQKEVVELIMDKKAELKLYCPLSGELLAPGHTSGQELNGNELAEFQDVILQRLRNDQVQFRSARGLMADFDGLDYVDDKVFSAFPSIEEVDGQLYGVAVCQLKGRLSPGELEELKEFCAGQFSYGWGEDLRERPCATEHGDLYVGFWQDSGATILTKEEMEAARHPSRPSCQPKKDRGEYGGR